MLFKKYIHKPYVVEAVTISEDNFATVADLIGHPDPENGNRVRTDEDGNPYIVPDRRLIPNVYKVYLGYILTRIGDKYHCYAPHIFEEQFTDHGYLVTFAIDDNDKVIDASQRPEGIRVGRVGHSD